MVYIFLDESGDLGFDFQKKRTSRYFVVTALVTDNKRPIEKLVKDIHRHLRKKYRMKSGTLHAAHEDPSTCFRFCKKLSTKDVYIASVFLDKQKVSTAMRQETHILFNFLVRALLNRLLIHRLINGTETTKLILARRETSKYLNKGIKEYLTDRMNTVRIPKLLLQIEMPNREKGLQAVDIASWALFRKYEFGDSKYSKLLQPIVTEEYPVSI
jgi:hypothetical protein